MAASTNKCLGSYFDELKQIIYYFVYNTNGYNGIYMYDMKIGTISPVLVSYIDSTTDIFNFNLNYPIVSVNMLYRTEEDGDILHWTDRNNNPMKLNVKEALNKTSTNPYYNTNTNRVEYKRDFLLVARKMPIIPAIAEFKNDTSVNINNLKNKLLQFKYRWLYRDDTKSAWSPWSKMTSPVNIDDYTNDINPKVNNRVDLLVQTGDKDCNKIEIAFRHSLAETFTGTMSIIVLDKVKSSIANNSTTKYNFYNDSAYAYVDEIEDIVLFDYVPKKANAQELLNGNILIYGGITEGNTFSETLDITPYISTVPSKILLNITPSTFSGSSVFTYYFSNTLTVQDTVTLNFTLRKVGGELVSFSFSTSGVNTIEGLLSVFVDLIGRDSQLSCSSLYGHTLVIDQENRSLWSDVADASSSVLYGDTTSSKETSNAVYKHNSRYSFGIVYYDEFGVTNGVVTNDKMNIITPEYSSTNVAVDAANIPSIKFMLVSKPPIWAKYFSFVRTPNLTNSYFLNILTDNTYKDYSYGYFNITKYNKNTDNYPTYSFESGDRLRIYGKKGGTSSVTDVSISDLMVAPPSGSTGWPTAGFFIKCPYDSLSMSNFGTTGYDNYLIEVYRPSSSAGVSNQIFYEFGETYNVINPGTTNRAHESKDSPAAVGYNLSIPPPTGIVNALVTVTSVSDGNLSVGGYKYKIANVTAAGQSVGGLESDTYTTFDGPLGSFRKIGIYNVPLSTATGVTARKIYRTKANDFSAYYLLTTINDNTTTLVNYTDNTSDANLGALMPNPPSYTFTKGDVYTIKRPAAAVAATNIHVISQSASYKFESKVAGNGRPFVEDAYAREMYYPSTIRYSLQYFQNTNINGTNRFLSGNIDDYDRQRGDIQRFKVRASQLRVFQSRACGVVPVLQNVLQTADGNNVIAQSTQILNKIQYYQGIYGIGNQYCSLASSARADYFTDPILGFQVRLSQDGLTSISEIYKGHFYFNKILVNYQKDWTYSGGGKAKILGVYDNFEQEFITCLQPGTISSTTIPAYTFSFSESRNVYSAFYDYNPEWICSAGNYIISWKNGEMWIHNNTSAYANFYGVQYSPSIKLVFNDSPVTKKRYNTIMTLSNDKWVAATDGDIKTNLGQNSSLSTDDYIRRDDKYHASFKRASNSTGGLYNGNVLKGGWMEINLKPVSPQNLVDLYYVETSILQPFNNR